MNNIKSQNLVIFTIKIKMKQIFTISKPNIMKNLKISANMFNVLLLVY